MRLEFFSPNHGIGRQDRERRATQRDRRVLNGTMKYQGEFMPIEIINLSEHGALVVAPVTPVLADVVTVTIGLPQIGSSVMISGRVRRVTLTSKTFDRQGGFGIQFTRFYTRVGKNDLREHLAA